MVKYLYHEDNFPNLRTLEMDFLRFLTPEGGFTDENSVWILDTILNDIYERKQLNEQIPQKGMD